MPDKNFKKQLSFSIATKSRIELNFKIFLTTTKTKNISFIYPNPIKQHTFSTERCSEFFLFSYRKKNFQTRQKLREGRETNLFSKPAPVGWNTADKTSSERSKKARKDIHLQNFQLRLAIMATIYSRRLAPNFETKVLESKLLALYSVP